MIRLDKYLCDAGCGTRSEVKKQIQKGRVTVNGETVRKAEQKVDPECDAVVCDGKAVRYRLFRYYMLNKPAGVVSATKDNREKTVLELLPKEERRNLFPAGRLDKDTEGLLLLTDDGPLAHRMLSPKYHVDKTYEILAEGIVGEEDLQQLREGIDIGEEKPTRPAKAELLEVREAENRSRLLLTIHEGKFHQVKRMMQAVGKPVLYLKRLSMGSLRLDEHLAPGEFRELTAEEEALLKMHN